MKLQNILSVAVLIACIYADTSAIITMPGQRVWDLAAIGLDQSCIAESRLDSLIVDLDIKGTFTVIDEIQSKLCFADSLLDDIESKLSVAAEVDFFGTFTVIAAIQSKVCEIDSKTDIIDEDADTIKDCFGIPIRQSDVGTTGFTISTPGRYYLAEDIDFSPLVITLNAITIAVDDVTLDLNNRTIRQTNAVLLTDGISATGSRSRIRIENGTLQDFSSVGIRIATGSRFIVRNVTLKDNNIGLNIDTGNVFSIEQVTTSGGVTGIHITTSTGFVLSGCLVEKSTDIGFLIENATNSDFCIKNCKSIGNNLDGFTISESNNFVIIDCVAENNAADGFDFDTSIDFAMVNCVSRNNAARGVSVDDENKRGVFIGNVISDNAIDGIGMDANSGVINCLFFNNTMNENSAINFNETTGNGPNSILGNFAFNTAGSVSNYVGNLSFLNTVTVSQSGPAPTVQPTLWHNINMIP